MKNEFFSLNLRKKYQEIIREWAIIGLNIRMNILKRVVSAVDFIEANLDKPITLADVSRAVNFSPFHFHRIFRAFVGESVSDYIKKRRLTKAAEQLIETDGKIIDIAFDNFFESQEAFTRAFERFFHLSPARYRKRGIRTIILTNKR